MNLLLYKISVMCFVLPFFILAKQPDWKGKYTKEKKMHKEYEVNTDALLQIDNNYGNLYITSWDEDRVVIEVVIKTNGDDEEKVQQKLKEIDVEFLGTRSKVSAKTILSTENSSWNWNWKWWKSDNVNMEINYIIKLPINNAIDLSNDYGSITLDKINGKAIISCDYGKLILGELNGEGNELSLDYTNNSVISYMNGGVIKADYSEFEIEKANNLKIKADYTSSKIGVVRNLQYECDYGNLSVDFIKENVEGNSGYLTAKIGNVEGALSLKSDYGSIKIEELKTEARDVTINANYTGIKVGYANNYHFDFIFDLKYASLKHGDEFDFKIKRQEVTDTYYEGHHGSKGKNKVKIKSDYGSVSFVKKQ